MFRVASSRSSERESSFPLRDWYGAGGNGRFRLTGEMNGRSIDPKKKKKQGKQIKNKNRIPRNVLSAMGRTQKVGW